MENKTKSLNSIQINNLFESQNHNPLNDVIHEDSILQTESDFFYQDLSIYNDSADLSLQKTNLVSHIQWQLKQLKEMMDRNSYLLSEVTDIISLK